MQRVFKLCEELANRDAPRVFGKLQGTYGAGNSGKPWRMGKPMKFEVNLSWAFFLVVKLKTQKKTTEIKTRQMCELKSFIWSLTQV